MVIASVTERRSHPRTEVSWPVRMWVDEDMLIGRAIDISEQGLCVITAPTDALKRGVCYRIDVVIDAQNQFSCQGEVRHMTSSLVGLRTVERLKLSE
jgi:PilZ domain-containing protein